MIALFGPIKADVLESDLPFLKLRPQRKLSETPQFVSVKLGESHFRLRVRAIERDAQGLTRVEVVDSSALGADVLRGLAQVNERRIGYREKAQLAVRSPDLPSFRATTVDVSALGLRLATSGPVEVGVKLRLEIDDRNPSQRPTDVSGVTVWSARRAEGQYQVGVRLLAYN